MTFLKECWYMAGWSVDFVRQPATRRIIDRPLVLYRAEDGSMIVLDDTCPHRFAMLSPGKLVGDHIECPYHGLQFDRTGACVVNPHSDTIPKAARINTYPVHEQDGIVWVWMGRPENADIAQIARFEMLTRPEQFTYAPAQTLEMDLNYELIVDNLMDLSHVQFTHANSLGSDMLVPGQISVVEDGEAIFSNRTGPAGSAPPWAVLSGACKADDRPDYILDMRWTKPASFYLYAAVVEAGRPRSEGKQLSSVQILTPASENKTYYFITHMRDYRRDDAELSALLADSIAAAFKAEDEPTVAGVAERMAGRDLWDMNPVLLPCDGGAVRVRRRREGLLKAEADLYASTPAV